MRFVLCLVYILDVFGEYSIDEEASGEVRGGARSFPTRGLTLPTRGLTYGSQGTINAKDLRKITFHLSTGGYSLPGATPG